MKKPLSLSFLLVCLGNQMSLYVHLMIIIPVPLWNRVRTLFLSEKQESFIQTQGREKLFFYGQLIKTAALPVQFKEGKKKDKQNM